MADEAEQTLNEEEPGSSTGDEEIEEEAEPAAGGETGVDGEPESRVPDTVPYERFREVNEKAKKAEDYEQLLNDPQRLRAFLEQQGFLAPQTGPGPEVPEDWDYYTDVEKRLYIENEELKRRIGGTEQTVQQQVFEQAKSRYFGAMDVIEAREKIPLTPEEKQKSLVLAVGIANANPQMTEAQIAETVYRSLAFDKLKAGDAARVAGVRQAKSGLAGTQVSGRSGPTQEEPEQYTSIREAVQAAAFKQ